MTAPADGQSRLQEALGRLVFSRALVAVMLANLMTLIVMNTFALRPIHLLMVYPLALGAGALAMARARVRRLATPVPSALVAYAMGFAVFLSLLRLPYLLEWLPGNVVLVTGDDCGRLAELISMTLSERFPLRHFANQDYLLSHYYSPFFPMAPACQTHTPMKIHVSLGRWDGRHARPRNQE